MPDAGAPVMLPKCVFDASASMPLAMTNAEYDRTVRDLLGESGSVSTVEGFGPDSRMESGFRYQPAPVTALRQAQLAKAANDLAENAVAHLAQILPCDPAVTGDCLEQFITTFGRRAFRRPLTDIELKMYDQGFPRDASFAMKAQMVIASMLSSPSFYEIVPEGSVPGVVQLTPYELASRLSYFIYRSMPDSALLDAAANGKLVTTADIEAQARRMLLSPKAHDAVTDFFAEWLSLDGLALTEKDPAVLPTFDAVRADMATETIKFTESVFFGDGRLESLLESSTTWINEPLAQLYGQPGVVGMPFQQVKLDPKTRAGILTQASFLSLTSNASMTSPTRRGKFVLEKLLCGAVPPHPPNVPETLPDTPGQTTRERLAMAVAQPACMACHNLMDPIGFGFEGFDPVGRVRATDNGLPVDASGTVTGDDPGAPFVGAVDLSSQLASNSAAVSCATTQWLRFALSRQDVGGDGCGIAFQTTSTLQELVVAIATSDSFRYARW
jgi:hypothetical protein